MKSPNSDITIYDLSPLEVEILQVLHREPRRSEFLADVNSSWLTIITKHVCRSLVWYNAPEALFMITFRGVAQLKAIGKSVRGLPKWKENQHEMTAKRAIELFAPVLVTEKKSNYRPLSDPAVKRSKKIIPD